ncbi:MAG: division/cell wall cluster transcriptional repressor MraZ [Elusimicrobia bacterium]|nr:MAG: division/cell wall cluster transcriptional repressor MraZ [Elusimicrobiota bacterium]
MLIGQYRHSLDGKNRLFIPARLRQNVRKFIITSGLEGCLFVYTPENWIKITERLKTLPLTKADARKFLRTFLSGANECPVDDQGRILIPKTLCSYANIRKEVIVVGVLDRIEIWSKSNWERYQKEAEKQFVEVAEKLVDLGI